MGYFILEIGTEEMPARFLPGLEHELQHLFELGLQEKRILFESSEVYSTPRRLVLCCSDISLVQEQREEIITGPPVSIAYDDQGNLTKAGWGFSRHQGAKEQELFVQQTEKGEYLAVSKQLGGAKTPDLLPEICVQALESLSFAKKMRWEKSGFTFGRPVRWLLALFDNLVVPVQVGSLIADRYTWGHRVLGVGPWEVGKAEDYFQVVQEKGQVVLDASKRRQYILDKGKKLAQEKQGSVVWNEELLKEVANLVEYPKIILGHFDVRYLDLPKEVLLTSMEKHQKCFGVEAGENKLLPYFISVLNLEPKDENLVKKGWERVLKARLEDATFFWKTDLRESLEQWVNKLDQVVFLAPLGSMGDKVRRLQELGVYIAQRSASGLEEELKRAAMLSKADLVSEMVGEFPELQGIMGGIYAREKGESEIVAQAIYEHYLPAGYESNVPYSLAGALLSIVDKSDTLVGCFGLNMMPSGAQDPYALRRSAIGILRVILEHDLRISLYQLLKQAQENYGDLKWECSPQESIKALLEFFAQRIRAHFISQGYDTLIVEASLGAGFDNFASMSKRLQALDQFSREQDFKQAVLTFKRADNILRKQNGKVQELLKGNYNSDWLVEPQEKELASQLEHIEPHWNFMWEEENFQYLFGLLRELRPFVDSFFDNVMVMCDDNNLRYNRLNLLKALVNRLSLLADFGALQI